jgi:hypothetical protein
MFGCKQHQSHRTEQVENDWLKGKDGFIFMHKVDSGNLSLNNVPGECSCIQARYEQDFKSNLKRSSRSFIQMPRKSRSSVELVVCS